MVKDDPSWGMTTIRYRRIFLILWKIIEGPDDYTPRHCIRLFGTRYLLQIKPMPKGEYIKTVDCTYE